MKKLKIIISKIIIATLIGMVSFSVAHQITESFDILFTNAWSGWINIFLYPVYLFILISIMSLLFFSAWNIINYIFIKTGFIEIEEGFREKFQFFKRITDNRSFIGVVGNTFYKTLLTVMVVVALFFAFIVLVSSEIRERSNKYYEKSFHINMQTNDYNDSRIIFYNEELEEVSRAFINANNDYDIFKAFTQKEMALECISILLKEHNEFAISKLLDGFKRSARNKYAYNKSLIAKNRDNERSFRNNIDYYRSNITVPASLFLKQTMPKRCEEKVAVEKMCGAFIPKYIELTEEEAFAYEKALPIAQNPNYTKRKMEHLYNWVKVIRGRYEGENKAKIL